MSDMTPAKAQALLDGIAPTPWRISPTDDCVVQARDRSEVADITGDYNNPDLWPIMEANARLIAAAPDLARAYIAQAAELTRLRARIEAADNLASELTNLLEVYSKPDGRMCCDGQMCVCQGSTLYDHAEHYARAALSAYEGGKE